MKTPRETIEILDRLETQHPDADTELHYRTPYELLVATILSAQSTDERVNLVTPALFKRYPNAAALAKATTRKLEPQIHSTGFFRAKSKALLGMAQALVAAHGGEVPASMEALVELPGVGRKTANVVLGHALGVPGSRSIVTSFASRTASASPNPTARKSLNNNSATGCRPIAGRGRRTR